MATQKYWLRDNNTGTYAQADGAAERDLWASRGWLPTDDEPAPSDRVQLYHPDTGGYQVLTREAADGLWNGVGWVYGAPPEQPDLTKDPALVDQPPAARTTTTAKAAASGDTKEK